MEYVKQRLDMLAERYNKPSFIESDPIKFPRMFGDRKDVETAAFLASTISWGRRVSILNDCKRLLFDIMKGQPYKFISECAFNDLDDMQPVHRTLHGKDLKYICRGLKRCFDLSHGDCSLEYIFARSNDVWSGFDRIRDIMADANSGIYNKHIASSKSPCKRLNLFMRWMVRNDGIVDLGIWSSFNTSDLIIPLDVHVAAMARKEGLIRYNKRDDKKAAIELTSNLSEFDSKDPCKYDFALFGLGVEESKFI